MARLNPCQEKAWQDYGKAVFSDYHEVAISAIFL